MSETLINGVRFLTSMVDRPDLSQYTQDRVTRWAGNWLRGKTGAAVHLRAVRVWTAPPETVETAPLTGAMLHGGGMLVSLYGRQGHCTLLWNMGMPDDKGFSAGLDAALDKIIREPRREEVSTA